MNMQIYTKVNLIQSNTHTHTNSNFRYSRLYNIFLLTIIILLYLIIVVPLIITHLLIIYPCLKYSLFICFENFIITTARSKVGFFTSGGLLLFINRSVGQSVGQLVSQWDIRQMDSQLVNLPNMDYLLNLVNPITDSNSSN